MSCGRLVCGFPCCSVILGNGLDVLRSGQYESIITDPPYGLTFKGSEWDKEIPDWLALARACSSTVIFTTAPLTLWDYPKPNWVLCWYRPASSARSLLKGGFNHWSPVLVYGKPKFPVDCKNLHAIQHARPKGFPHPSPKPLALLEWLVQHGSQEFVLDPFCGSGTTLQAAKKLGRHFLGVDTNQEYCELSRKNLELTDEHVQAL